MLRAVRVSGGAVAVAEHAPLYDPAVHTVEDGDPTVYVELFCRCGSGVLRQRDPVSYVEPMVRRFLDRHSAPACGPASKAAFVEARETLRQAAATLARQEYEPRDYPRLVVDDKPRPWPVLEG